MKMIIRVLLGLVSVLSILMALRFWTDPLLIAAQLGVGPIEFAARLGQATLRADFPAFFGSWGVLCLTGLISGNRQWLVAPIALTGTALAGRFLNLALAGAGPREIQPMVVEAIAVGVAAAAYQAMRKPS